MPINGVLIGLVQGGSAWLPSRRRFAAMSRAGSFPMCSTAVTPIAASGRIRRRFWRFAIVAGVGFLLTWAVMHRLVDRWHLPYLPAQILTTGIVLVWSFSAHKWWTFREHREG